MKILVNDTEKIIDREFITVDELVKSLDVERDGIALCVNGDIVRKASFSEFVIRDGDRVDIITMVGGG